jgi:hypothetical protein
MIVGHPAGAFRLAWDIRRLFLGGTARTGRCPYRGRGAFCYALRKVLLCARRRPVASPATLRPGSVVGLNSRSAKRVVGDDCLGRDAHSLAPRGSDRGLDAGTRETPAPRTRHAVPSAVEPLPPLQAQGETEFAPLPRSVRLASLTRDSRSTSVCFERIVSAERFLAVSLLHQEARVPLVKRPLPVSFAHDVADEVFSTRSSRRLLRLKRQARPSNAPREEQTGRSGVVVRATHAFGGLRPPVSYTSGLYALAAPLRHARHRIGANQESLSATKAAYIIRVKPNRPVLRSQNGNRRRGARGCAPRHNRSNQDHVPSASSHGRPPQQQLPRRSRRVESRRTVWPIFVPAGIFVA